MKTPPVTGFSPVVVERYTSTEIKQGDFKLGRSEDTLQQMTPREETKSPISRGVDVVLGFCVSVGSQVIKLVSADTDEEDILPPPVPTALKRYRGESDSEVSESKSICLGSAAIQGVTDVAPLLEESSRVSGFQEMKKMLDTSLVTFQQLNATLNKLNAECDRIEKEQAEFFANNPLEKKALDDFRDFVYQQRLVLSVKADSSISIVEEMIEDRERQLKNLEGSFIQ